ncbi:MAG: type II secretion system protein [Candidatus Riflebacteria bacterium]|nr:type II secretion system protein [Candidatus Riflebacteria bacterium]
MKPAKKPVRHQGFTMIELVVVAGLVALLGMLFVRGMNMTANSVDIQERMDMMARIRNTSYLMSKELSYSAGFLYPPLSATGFSSHMIFRNALNEIVGFFLSPEGLMFFNYTQNVNRLIFPEVASFQCRLVNQNLVEYTLRVKKKNADFTLWNQLSTFNTLP